LIIALKMCITIAEPKIRRKRQGLGLGLLAKAPASTENRGWNKGEEDTIVSLHDQICSFYTVQKIVPEMTYKMSSGTLNLCSLTLYSTF